MLRHLLICSMAITIVGSEKFLLDRDALRQLDSWELQVLRDFIRGKGHPMLQRIPLDSFGESEEIKLNPSDLLDLNNPALVTQGGLDLGPPPSLLNPMKPSIISPASRRNVKTKKDTEPSVEDYENLANVIQMFIDRRSIPPPKQKKVKTKDYRKSSAERKSTKIPIKSTTPNVLSHVITASTNDADMVTFDLRNASPNRRPMPARYIENKDKTKEPPTTKTREMYEKRMEELSAELTKVMKQLEYNKKPLPTVHVLRNGSAEQTPDGQFIFICTVTLIRDEDKNILVDTGIGTNLNARNALIQSVRDQGLEPSDIDFVVTTHGHPDHSGGLQDFPDAVHYYSWYSHHRNKFNLTSLFETDSLNITSNVVLVRSRGHTSDDIAVVVKGEETMGDVLVSGDLFMRKEDLDHPRMWQPLSMDINAQADARGKLGCAVNWIVPGHGPAFEVDHQVKSALKCMIFNGNYRNK